MKKNVLILIAHYLPGSKMGGPLVSIYNLVNNLSEYYNFKIITSDRDFGENIPYKNIKVNQWNKVGNADVYYMSRDGFSVFSILRLINKTSHDVLYLNSLFDPLFSLSVVVGKKFKIIQSSRIIIAPRGELFDEALKFKRLKKKIFLWVAKAFKLYKELFWHATNEKERNYIIQNAKVEISKIKMAMIISAQSNLENVYSDDQRDNTVLKIVFLARISKDKNLPFAFDVLANVKPNVVFDIYGPIEDNYIWEVCQAKQQLLPNNIKVNYMGVISREKIHFTLYQYDLFFLPTFAENFGHSIAESLSAGTPVLISDNTPWRELARKNYGWDLSLNNPDLFINVINKFSTTSNEERKAKRKFIQQNIIKELNSKEIINENINLFKL